jgi:hypothetical protein
MPTRIALCSVLLILLAVSVHAQYVYGDRSTKKYFAIECAEVESIKQADRQGFKSSADAEKAGYSKGDACNPSIAATAPIVARRPSTQEPKRKSRITVGELRKDAVTLIMIETEFSKYRGGSQKFVGFIEPTPYYIGKYENRQRDMWAFTLCDDTGCGYFYMAKNFHSDEMRNLILDPTRADKLLWTCQYIPEQLPFLEEAGSYVVAGEVSSCTYRVLSD